MDMVSWVKQVASVSLALAILSVDAWSQEVPPEVSMCQSAMKQLYLWCGNQQQGSVQAGFNCAQATNDVERLCYHDNLPKLGCAAAQKESELWCGGNVTQSVMTGYNCTKVQRKVRALCFGER